MRCLDRDQGTGGVPRASSGLQDSGANPSRSSKIDGVSVSVGGATSLAPPPETDATPGAVDLDRLLHASERPMTAVSMEM
jgi:hypothetical protein